MRDIISQGGDREPSAWPRRLAVIAVLAVVAAVLVVRYLPDGRPAPARPAQAAASATPVPQVASGLALRVHSQPEGVAGPTRPWDRSLRLPAAGAQPTWFWPATGREEAIGGLPRHNSGYVFRRIGGGWAIQPGPGAPHGCGNCARLIPAGWSPPPCSAPRPRPTGRC